MPETVSALNRKDPELEAFVKESVGVMVIWLAPEQAVLWETPWPYSSDLLLVLAKPGLGLEGQYRHYEPHPCNQACFDRIISANSPRNLGLQGLF